MKRFIFVFVAALAVFADVGHLDVGTSYDKEGAHLYAESKHGPDGALFLDPYFIPYLTDVDGLNLLDAGCGAAPWSIFACRNGAHVFGIDLQDEMIAIGREKVEQAGLSGKVQLCVGDVADLPCVDGVFDRAVSINVVCNLPSSCVVDGKGAGFGAHVQEMYRTLKEGGKAIVTAPGSLGVVFTDGSEGVFEHIELLLSELPNEPSDAEIKAKLNQLTEVYRATFALKEGRLVLIRDERELELGEPIWRKIPGLTVPNRYHSEEEYLTEFANAGFVIEAVHQPLGGSLGKEYVDHYPFTTYCLVKKP